MIDAQILTLAAGGIWHGRYGTAPCPVCQPERRKEQTALTLTDGASRLLLNCKKSACAFHDIAAALGIVPGTSTLPDPVTIAQRDADRRQEAAKRAAQARAIWQEAVPIRGTIAQTYLRGRGITCALPDTLRYHGEVWHGPTARRLPALVARVDGGSGFAVHRTFLRPNGNGKADVPEGTDKMMLGGCAGGAVRLVSAPGRLVVAEGLETALSLSCGLLDGPATIWAALSTSGMRGLHLPANPARLTVACDGEPAGRSAGLALADRAHRLGWHVDLIDPGDGADFNDLLREGVTL